MGSVFFKLSIFVITYLIIRIITYIYLDISITFEDGLFFGYILLGMLNVYLFLIQRTARDISKIILNFKNRTNDVNSFLPSEFIILYYLSLLRYILLVWLVFTRWEIAVGGALLIQFFKLVLPVNDYQNIQIIKKYLSKKIHIDIISFMNYYDVIEIEEKLGDQKSIWKVYLKEKIKNDFENIITKKPDNEE